MLKIKIILIHTLIILLLSSCATQKSLNNQSALQELTLVKAQKLMISGQLTSVKLVNYYLARINKYDQHGIKLMSIAQINPNALSIAKQRDIERQQGRLKGSLHGIPVLLKDNIDTADGMPNTAGSLALKNNYPSKDALIVKKLREEGAIILGKTNLSEWANFRSTNSSSGWSALWGQAKNPYDVTKSTCGSSAGSGSAVASDFTLLAIGTETDGSITCPSSVNGIVGIKPSLGTVSQVGIIPIAHSQDTAGPMARTVTDAVYLLQAIRDKNHKIPLLSVDNENYVHHLIKSGLKNKRIGIARNLMGYDPELDKVFEKAVINIVQQGAIVVDDIKIPHVEKLGRLEYEVLLYEFKYGLNKYFKTSNLNLTLEKVIAFNRQNKELEMTHFGQEIFHLAQKKGSLSDKAYIKALHMAKRLAGPEGIDAVLEKYNLDLLIAPTTQPAWTTDLENGDISISSASTPAAVAGYPHITVPMGFIHNLPVGISFFGANYSEPTLIEAAFSYEQATNHRRKPNLD